jgi:hypothetical protein
MRKLIVLSVVLLLGLAGNALADMHWDGEAGDGLWSTGLNWFGQWGCPDNTVPGATTIVRTLTVPGYGPTIANPGAVAGQVIVGEWSWPGQLTVTPSGDLTDNGPLEIANDAGFQGDVFNEGTINVAGDIYVGNNGNGTLTNSGTINTTNYPGPYNGTIIVGNNAGSTGVMTNTGDVDVGFFMYVGLNGNGLLNMNGGTIDVPNGSFCIGTTWDGIEVGPGHVNFHGGTVTTAGLTVNGGGSCTADFTEGVLIAKGNHTGGLDWLTSQNYWTAYSGSGTVMYDYDIPTDTTTVYGIPEPATVMLLGLGGLALVRRKR